MSDGQKYYLIREDVLPESVKKTLKVKKLLEREPQVSIFEAVKRYDLSRSAYYKFKDTIFPVEDQTRERNITLLVHVDDNVGLLYRILESIAAEKGSVLTIHQSLPIMEKATITISLNAREMRLTINELLDKLKQIDGVNQVQLLGMNM
ncbi:ACT domain-containing protein [Macrococcus brunensis]|uniref:ACT domain-containing protein n=1 Tax=Macrococcus brunensis TaxID=198483 RepID=UPI001EEF867B|nr:ACT domain-containing protein [Macrococcus brunensis]ULG71215.1 ACT domain-containing protein [Macrococcus brunensis]ULG73528.1 ACT domain-containing protein [Macrococcus brunensis]